MMAYLSVINNPADNVRLRRIINEPKRGIGAATVGRAAQQIAAAARATAMFEVICARRMNTPGSAAERRAG